MPRTRRNPTRRLQSSALRQILLAAALCALPGALAAQEAAPPAAATVAPAAASAAVVPDTAGCRRCLGGHRYMVSIVVPDPFVTTHFRSSVGGGGVEGLTTPLRNLDGQVIDTVGGDVAFVVLDFEYQYAATRWLGVRVGSSVQARIGTSARSLIASGAEALTGNSFGLTGRVWGTPTAEVSLTADYRNNDVYIADPYTFAQIIRENGAYTDEAREALLRKTTVSRFTGGVRGAWTLAPWVGLNGNFEAGTADDPRPDKGKQTVTEVGGLAGFEFGLVSRVPVALTVGGRYQNGTGRGAGLAGNAGTLALGLFYTGRPHFLIGGESTWSTVDFEQAEVSNVDVIQFRLITRYDF